VVSEQQGKIRLEEGHLPKLQ